MTESAVSWRGSVADTVVYAVLFGLGNLVSYLYIVVAGRQLGPADFGAFNALLGLLTLAGVVAAAIQAAVAQAVTAAAARSVVSALLRRIATVSAPLVIVGGALALPFADAIGAGTRNLLVLGVAVWMSVVAAASLGVVIGAGRVRAPAAINLAGALARLGAGWPLMLLGFGIGAALAGYVINYLVVLAIAAFIGFRAIAVDGSAKPAGEHLRLDAHGIATFIFAFAPFCLDQVLVQFFSPQLGGDYAATATIARLIFFMTYPVTAIAYARMLSEADGARRQRVLAAAAIAVIVAAMLLYLLLSFFPAAFLSFFFAGRFTAALPQIGELAFGIACFSLSALAAHALIAYRCRRGFAVSALAFTIGVALFAWRHDSLAALVANQVWVCVIQMVLVCAQLGVVLRHSPSPAEAR